MDQVTLLPPSAAGAGYHHSSIGYGYGHQGYGCIPELILSNQVGGGFQDTMNTIHTSAAHTVSAVEHTGLAGIQETARQGSTVMHEVAQGASLNLASTERNGGETRLAIERNSGESRAMIDRLAIAAARDIADIRREACENKSEIVLEGCKNTNALTLQAAENKAVLMAQIAECCCELKELTRAEAGATRDLIREGENNRLRDRLADLQNENNLLKLEVNVGGVRRAA